MQNPYIWHALPNCCGSLAVMCVSPQTQPASAASLHSHPCHRQALSLQCDQARLWPASHAAVQALGAEAALLQESSAGRSPAPDACQAFASLLADLAALHQGQNRAARSLYHERLMAAHLKAQAGRVGGGAASRGRGGSAPQGVPPGGGLGQAQARSPPAANGWMSKILPGALAAPQPPGPRPVPQGQAPGPSPGPAAASGAARQPAAGGSSSPRGEAARAPPPPQAAGAASGMFGNLASLTRSFAERAGSQQQH